MVDSGNIYKQIPDDLGEEIYERLAKGNNVKIERIISMGHKSPDTGWYDQEQNEWVLLLKDDASISFDNEVVVHLEEGDYLNIPAHKKHKVLSTSPVTETIWLAIFY